MKVPSLNSYGAMFASVVLLIIVKSPTAHPVHAEQVWFDVEKSKDPTISVAKYVECRPFRNGFFEFVGIGIQLVD